MNRTGHDPAVTTIDAAPRLQVVDADPVTLRDRYGRLVPGLTCEVVAIVAVYLGYRQARSIARDQGAEAFENARRVVDLEQHLNVFSERAAQRIAMHHDAVIWALNHYYVKVHFPLTTAFALWMLLRHRDSYRWIRTWLVTVTLAALVIHVAFPLAPPRMLPAHGFIDTLRANGLHIYSADPNRSVANQFAAMPSLHFGWSVIVAAGFVSVRRTALSRRVRSSGDHPHCDRRETANHYWIDAWVAVVLVVGTLLVGRAGLTRWRRRPNRASNVR